MNKQIEGDDNPLHRGQTDQLGIAKESSSAVVVGMKEGEGLLLEHQEDGIDELDIFVQVIKLKEKNRSVSRIDHY